MSDYSWSSNPWVWALTFRRVPVSDAKAHPLLFSGPMVRAILEDRKTQTRRVINPQPSWIGRAILFSLKWISSGSDDWRICPYGRPGDLLWVRETFLLDERNTKGRIPQEVIFDATPEWALDHTGGLVRVRYITGQIVPPDAARLSIDTNRFWHRHPAIFLPRWACRIMLQITDVRAQRVQEISEEDAIAEGVEDTRISQDQVASARIDYRELWDKINGKRKPRERSAA